MRALSIRQPYAEAILRRVKTIEYRSRPTRIVGEPFFIYATKRKVPVTVGREAPADAGVWSSDLAVPAEPPAPWVTELAAMLRLYDPDHAWPTGVIVGTAVIDRVTSAGGLYHWHLTEVRRLPVPRKPTRHPQPAWFNPF